MTELAEKLLNGHERRRLATRNKILEAAREILRESGHSSALTNVDVANRAGVSQATIYKIFATRDELLNAAYSFPRFKQFVDNVAARPTTEHPLRRLLAGFQEATSAVTAGEFAVAIAGPEQHEDVMILGLRTRAEGLLAEELAEALRRKPSTVTADQARLWALAFIAASHAAEPTQASELNLKKFLTRLTRSVEFLLAGE